jgi:formate C-acetyltransferase
MKTMNGTKWTREIDVRDFIQNNYTPYDGDASFLAPATDRTRAMWAKLGELIKEELSKGILDLDTKTPSSVTSHAAGYIDKANEVIVGLQTDAPLKRSIKPNGGIRLVEKAAEAYGYKVAEDVSEIFTKYRKTHNDGVFAAYDDEIKMLRSKHVITGLPDNYGRGRIIGDYRRLALYGADALIADRKKYLKFMSPVMNDENIRTREEIFDQITALEDVKTMAALYGFDVSNPAVDSKDAVQYVYFAYLAAVKQQDGAAMSLGRIDAFLDIYFENDLAQKKYTEEQIQEMVDDFVMKLRIVRHLRPPEYNALFAGDPTWVTIVLGGTGLDGRNMVTKTSYRFLHTLTNLGPAPEPNLTVLWGDKLPGSWKNYCAFQSISTSSIQYENDDLMKNYYGDDYAIACCVSGMAVGKDMQLFGARANIVKVLLLAINGGKEEPNKLEDGSMTSGGATILPGLKTLNSKEYLDYDEVWNQFLVILDKVAEKYVATMNVIHYMHEKYHYESVEMALHDVNIRRFMAFGAAGLSIVADSLSAIKYAKVKPIWNEQGVAVGYETEGEYPRYGNDDDRVDGIAVNVVEEFIKRLRKYPAYRNAIHTLSILTITSNVVYGKATGATPDGREAAVPFAPGANPMHGRDKNGAIASLNSVAKIPYDYAQDGISNTFSIVPHALGKTEGDRIANLAQMMDGYFVGKGAHHLNVNVMNKEMLLDAQLHPEEYPQLTIRVSGYAVLFNRLSKTQQDEVIARTFHERV